MSPAPILGDFKSLVRIEPSGCWIWKHGSAARYGRVPARIYRLTGDHAAHRSSWIIANGPIPAGLVVCHRCDVTRCVNPEHLFLGTTADNVRDAIEKGRQLQWLRTKVCLDGTPAKDKRRTHCRRGHELTGDNVYVAPTTLVTAWHVGARLRSATH